MAQRSSPRAPDGRAARDLAHVEDGDGERISDAHRFARSTSLPMDGNSPCFVSRRRSASAAERYCVGSTPKPRNTLRHAASVGSSLSGVSPIRATAARGSLEGRGESGRSRVVVDAGRIDHATDDRRKALDDVWVVSELSHVTQSRRCAGLQHCELEPVHRGSASPGRGQALRPDSKPSRGFSPATLGKDPKERHRSLGFRRFNDGSSMSRSRWRPSAVGGSRPRRDC